MTPHEIELAKALGGCSFCPATSQKRFARDIAFLAVNDPAREISDRQRYYLEIMAWRFRRQLPARLVPENKPPNLPPKRKEPKKKRQQIIEAEQQQALL